MAHTPTKQRISAHDLADQLAEQRVKVIDVREPMEYAGGHIAGSLNVPLVRLSQAQLLQQGHPHPLADLEGGIPAWRQAGLPLSRARHAPLPLVLSV
jgi:rhodanese-related sulfurtransferase